MPITKLFATGQQLAYAYTATTTTTLDLADTQLIADAGLGNLRDLLASVDNDIDWATLEDGAQGRVTLTVVPLTSDPNFVGVFFSVPTPGLRVLRITSTGNVAVRLRVQFIHSIMR